MQRTSEAEEFCRQRALIFLNKSWDYCHDFNHINLLLQMAASEKNAEAKPATAALYSIIIEGLCNDFTDKGVEICNEVLCHIISFLRTTPGGKELDNLLNLHNLTSETKLIERFKQINERRLPIETLKKKAKKIIILSRVTIGADVVITSVILQRLAKTFPGAELITIGPAHLEQLFHNFPGLRFVSIDYQRHGSIYDRVTAWPLIFSLVQKELIGFDGDEVLLFDPDSRLSQLGLLPIMDQSTTFFFPSRKTTANGSNPSLTELTNSWLNELLGENSFSSPFVSFKQEDEERAQIFMQKLPAHPFVISINLGVGQNETKRVPSPFEDTLLTEALNRENTLIILDSGKSMESKIHVEDLLQNARQKNIPTAFLSENDLKTADIRFTRGIIGFRGSVGAFGALIKFSDIFFGYDSCYQHIATALGIPAIIAFAGAPNSRFKARWTPFTQNGKTTTIYVDNAHRLSKEEIEHFAKKVASMLRKCPKHSP